MNRSKRLPGRPGGHRCVGALAGTRHNAWPELEKAKAACRKHKAKFVIAKLDRLSRNVAFIAALMDESHFSSQTKRKAVRRV